MPPPQIPISILREDDVCRANFCHQVPLIWERIWLSWVVAGYVAQRRAIGIGAPEGLDCPGPLVLLCPSILGTRHIELTPILPQTSSLIPLQSSFSVTMATNGVNGNGNGAEANGVSGWKHYNEGTFLFTVSLPGTKSHPPVR